MIKFYSKHKPYREFSNFYTRNMVIDGEVWPSVEHYFQACKGTTQTFRDLVRACETPAESKKCGASIPLREDWEKLEDGVPVKEKVMFMALLCKFTQHKDLHEILLSTGEEELIEDSPTDYYWGCGKDGSGRNRLGVLLMKVRTFLRKLEIHVN